MATTRLITMHINKGKTLAQCLEARTDYAQNPEKTEKGNLISTYECDPMTIITSFSIPLHWIACINSVTSSIQAWRCSMSATGSAWSMDYP